MRRRLADERGFAGGFEAIPFSLLVFVAGTLLLVNAWAVVDANAAAGAAAREAVRAFVESSGSDIEARTAAEEAAIAALEGHGRDRARMTIEWTGADLVRCQPVQVVVRYRVPTLAVPWLGSFGQGFLETSATHQEVVDPYRSGLPIDGFEAETCGA